MTSLTKELEYAKRSLANATHALEKKEYKGAAASLKNAVDYVNAAYNAIPVTPPPVPPTPPSPPTPPAPPAPPTPLVLNPYVADGTLSGKWKIVFDDEFNGTSLDLSRWKNPMRYNAGHNGQGQQMEYTAAGVSVSDGCCYLSNLSSVEAAGISSAQFDGAGPNGYEVKVGDYVETLIFLPGTSSVIYNYPSFWLDGQNWPGDGEEDVIEVLSGQPTDNYHSSSGSHNMGDVFGGVGNIVNKFVTLGFYRGATDYSAYLNGKRVNQYKSSDKGTPQAILITTSPAGKIPMLGSTGAVRLDYVRVWTPAS